MRARCDPGGLWRLDSVMCRSSGFAAFARGFAFGLALVFALAFGFAIAYSPTFALRVSPRPGGAPDTACPGATDDPASPPRSEERRVGKEWRTLRARRRR